MHYIICFGLEIKKLFSVTRLAVTKKPDFVAREQQSADQPDQNLLLDDA